MVTGTYIRATMSDGRPLQVLADQIARRSEVMKQSAADAATAIAIQALRSMRAATPKVKKRAAIIASRYRVEINRDESYKPGWSHGRRCVRQSGGAALRTVNGCGIINLAGPYDGNGDKNVSAYRLAIYGMNTRPFMPARQTWILCQARSEGDVRKYADARIKRRIQQYAGVSKRCLSACMTKVHGRGGRGGAEKLAADLVRLATRAADVKVDVSGYSAGRIGISVRDHVPFSADCLRESVDVCLGRAANGINAQLNRAAGTDVSKHLPTPFPEYTRKK